MSSGLDHDSVLGEDRAADPAVGTDVHGRSADQAAFHGRAGIHRQVAVALHAAEYSRAGADVKLAPRDEVAVRRYRPRESSRSSS